MNLSATTTAVPDEHAAAPAGAAATTAFSEPPSPRSSGLIYLWLALASLAIAAASLSFASTASYDPWSWIVWGREISHGTLSLTFGPSWKPLPVLFTTLFAPTGSAAPDLWLLVARFGATLAVLMSFRLAARIAWFSRPEREQPSGSLARVIAAVPALLAGLVAAWGLAFVAGFASDSAMGYSEGIAIAFTLIAIERVADGHHRQAFALGAVIAWERPESWLVWGPYGLWLMWRDPGSRALVIGLALATIAAWFVPQQLGGDSFTSSVSRAQQIDPGSPTVASFPFAAELSRRAIPSVARRSLFLLLAGLLAAIWPLLRRRTTFRDWFTSERSRAARWLCALTAAGAGWWIVVALETQGGFSGNERYVQIGSSLIDIAAGATLGWAAYALAAWLRVDRLRVWPRRIDEASRSGVSGRTPAWPTAILATLIVTGLFAFLPSGWIGNDGTSLSGLRYALHYESRLRRDLATVVRQGGGAAQLRACGNVVTENYQVPMVAWYLDLRIDQVGANPQVNSNGEDPVANGEWPAVILRAAPSRHDPPQPLATTIAGWQAQGARYSVAQTPTFRLYRDCR